MTATPSANARQNLHVRAGSSGDPTWDVMVTPESAGWGYSSLRVATLAPGQEVSLETGDDEAVVVPLSGDVRVAVQGGDTYELAGRASVFSGPADVLYLPQGTTARISSEGAGRVAVTGARVPEDAERLSPWVRRASDIPVELRGAGTCTREVHNFASADSPADYPAHKLIAVEVITPAGNWSSYPPHKHDETSEQESELEEIYYYEISPGPHDEPGFGYHRTYGTPDRPLDVLAEVRSGDTVLVPHGWHGPCVAAPVHHMYYLNVMAGPEGNRAWRIVDDPDHGWVRSTWPDQQPDPRLPLIDEQTLSDEHSSDTTRETR